MAALDNGSLDIRAAWVVLKSQPLSSAPGPPPSQLLLGRSVLPMGPVRSFCWTVPCLDLPCSPSHHHPPPSSMGAKEPPPTRRAPPGPENARSDCDIGVCERGFVFGEQSLRVGCGAARRGQAWPAQLGFLLAGPVICFLGMSRSPHSPVAAEGSARGRNSGEGSHTCPPASARHLLGGRGTCSSSLGLRLLWFQGHLLF